MRRREEAVRPPKDPEPEVFLPLPHLPFLVLLALARGPSHGWGILKTIGETAGEREVPSSGSLYLAMSRLEERGLIEGAPAPAEGDGRRKYVRCTALGRRVLAAEAARMDRLAGVAREWGGGAPPGEGGR